MNTDYNNNQNGLGNNNFTEPNIGGVNPNAYNQTQYNQTMNNSNTGSQPINYQGVNQVPNIQPNQASIPTGIANNSNEVNAQYNANQAYYNQSTPIESVNAVPNVAAQNFQQGYYGMNQNQANTMSGMQTVSSETNYQANTQVPIQQNIQTPNMQPNPVNAPQQPINQQPINQQPVNNAFEDNELLKAFIGNNYEKLTTRKFNFSGFLFSSLYIFYRKMFVLGLIIELVSSIISNFYPVAALLFAIVVGLTVNNMYLKYANKEIKKIKATNPGKSFEELKTICSKKGGTSGAGIFLGILISGAVASALNIDSINNITNPNNKNNNNNSNQNVIENASIAGYTCINSKCTLTVNDQDGKTTDYTIDENAIITKLSDYSKYINLDIYYNDDNAITKYKITSKNNNEDISDVKTEEELIKKLGLYTIGTYTEKLTFKENGTFNSYIFINDKNLELEMDYPDSSTSKLIENNKYTVTFEVTEGIFGYEYTIKEIA